MHFLLALSATLVCASCVSSSALPQHSTSDPNPDPDFDFDTDSLEYLNAQAISALADQEDDGLSLRSTDWGAPRCTLRNALVRKDW